MNMDTKQKALEDIKLIKETIKNTSTSMEALNHIFIAWGILFLVISIIFIIEFYIPFPVRVEGIMSSSGIVTSTVKSSIMPAIIFYCCSLLIWPLCFFVTKSLYKKITNIYPINGVSKQLISIWIYILIFLTICLIVSTNSGNFNTLKINFILIELTLFAFGLICIYAFTKFRFTFILALIYSFIGLYIMLSSNYSLLFSILLLPFTFLIIGIYLRLKERTVA